MKYRFCCYEHRLIYDNDKLLTKCLIVIKDQNNFIVKWTYLHKYLKPR